MKITFKENNKIKFCDLPLLSVFKESFRKSMTFIKVSNDGGLMCFNSINVESLERFLFDENMECSLIDSELIIG